MRSLIKLLMFDFSRFFLQDISSVFPANFFRFKFNRFRVVCIFVSQAFEHSIVPSYGSAQPTHQSRVKSTPVSRASSPHTTSKIVPTIGSLECLPVVENTRIEYPQASMSSATEEKNKSAISPKELLVCCTRLSNYSFIYL